MKKTVAALALLAALSQAPARAQNIPSQTVEAIPELTSPDQIKDPSAALPNDPIEPYLLTKENGPFMVLAKTFRGPDSQKLALALAKELREEFGLPAYILRTKDWPGRSNIRNVPPQADAQIARASVNVPEKYRTYDEAAVLVGDEKSHEAAVKLHAKVKKLKPKCLDTVSSFFPWREGLSKAIRTTNPYVASQNLYQHKPDRLVVEMNSGDGSLAHCPGQYSLQIAEFTGRATFNEKDSAFQGHLALLKSPLRTAASDAEKMANTLRKDKDVTKLGVPIFVYHDRTSSRVFAGSFASADDARAAAMRSDLLKLAVPLMDSRSRSKTLDTMIVPASALTDLTAIKRDLGN